MSPNLTPMQRKMANPCVDLGKIMKNKRVHVFSADRHPHGGIGRLNWVSIVLGASLNRLAIVKQWLVTLAKPGNLSGNQQGNSLQLPGVYHTRTYSVHHPEHFHFTHW